MSSVIDPGSIIDGKYRVVRRIGEGGMGTVYEGENVRIERRVAIKVLHAHVASTPEFAERFEREARASARVGSEHICDVLDLGDLPSGDRYLVMEFLEGESLEDRLERTRMTAEELAPIAFQILEGLGSMHHAGVIHRDLKPANIFLARVPRRGTEMVKILDFGVAKIVPRADQPNQMTSTGIMMGTPLYMSPEQARGARDVDGRTDLYAASAIFYRALTGDVPHIGTNLHELLFKIVLDDARPIREIIPNVDEAFAAIIAKGLARDADRRFSTAREYQEEIAAWGRSKGDPNLRFTITLSDRPPALQSLASGYPAELIAQYGALSQSSGDRAERAGPPTPQHGSRPHGTPMGWAEMTPDQLAHRDRALDPNATLESRHAGQTKVLDGRPFPSVADTGGSARPTATTNANPSPRSTGRAPAIAAVAAAALVALGVGTWLIAGRNGSTAAATPPASASSITASEPPPVTAAPTFEPAPSTPLDAPPPVAAAEPKPAVAEPAPRAPTTRVPSRSATAPAVKPSASASAAPPAVAASAAPPPAATTTSGHRKFRTNL